MQFLMILLVMIAVILLTLTAVLGISYGIGALMYSSEGGGVQTPGTDRCEHCHAERNWYEDLPVWKRNLVAVWWIANRYRCAAKGCG